MDNFMFWGKKGEASLDKPQSSEDEAARVARYGEEEKSRKAAEAKELERTRLQEKEKTAEIIRTQTREYAKELIAMIEGNQKLLRTVKQFVDAGHKTANDLVKERLDELNQRTAQISAPYEERIEELRSNAYSAEVLLDRAEIANVYLGIPSDDTVAKLIRDVESWGEKIMQMAEERNAAMDKEVSRSIYHTLLAEQRELRSLENELSGREVEISPKMLKDLQWARKNNDYGDIANSDGLKAQADDVLEGHRMRGEEVKINRNNLLGAIGLLFSLPEDTRNQALAETNVSHGKRFRFSADGTYIVDEQEEKKSYAGPMKMK